MKPHTLVINMKPLQFEWDKFLPTLRQDFPDILNEVLSYTHNQKHQPISNINNKQQTKLGINIIQ